MRLPPRIPPILVAGEEPVAAAPGGSGERYWLSPVPPTQPPPMPAAGAELAGGYGTRRLRLLARDPHSLYAHWDLTREQQAGYESLAADHRLVLRIHAHEPGQDAPEQPGPFQQVHLLPASRHHFLQVDRGGQRYVAELGYYGVTGDWIAIAASRPVLTPPATPSAETAVEFATIPPEIPLPVLREEVKTPVDTDLPWLVALRHAEETGRVRFSTRAWSRAQERALAEALSIQAERQAGISSLELAELPPQPTPPRQEVVPGGPAAPAPGPGAGPALVSNPTSPTVAASVAPTGGFWFNLNVELIVYGATEPDARVTVGGRPVELRPDGTFTLRFALPDGQHALPAAATAADGIDTRSAELRFSRQTDYRARVGAAPQDPGLAPPPPPG